MRRKKSTDFLRRNIVAIILAILMIGESVIFAIILSEKRTPYLSQPKFTIQLDTAEMVSDVQSAVESSITKFLSSIDKDGNLNIDIKNLDIEKSVKSVLFTDSVVNIMMQIAYPMLYNVVKELGMLRFAKNADLYPTGSDMAELFKNKPYTIYNREGEEKPLFEMLKTVDEDWAYLENKVMVNGQERSLWQTAKWNVTDENSFYAALNDMFAPLQGIFEIGIQGKSMNVNINVLDYVTSGTASGIDFGAATLFNTEIEEKTNGYEKAFIPLFNHLGLTEGEYPTVEEVKNYTSSGDFWKAVFGSTLKALNKIINSANPINALEEIALNFLCAIEDGSLLSAVDSIEISAKFASAASMLGYTDGQLYDVGRGVIAHLESFGININGNANDFIRSLVVLLTGDKDIVIPPVDLKKLESFTTVNALPNGVKVHTCTNAEPLKYVVDYIYNLQVK